ncbi:MAG: ribonuclease Z [Cyclobacteriaceae bacterium]|nr:ribonuclease Z [Flammeovirgaceae bacterium]
MSSLSLTILGSSAAVPANGRFPSSHYVAIQNRHFLIDCGEGTQMQLTRFNIPIQKINYILISHLHGDHYLGLMGLLFSMHLQKRQAELHLFGPPGLNEIILLQLKYSKSVLNYPLHFHAFDPTARTVIMEDAAVTVETIPLIHKLPCAGFLLKEKTKPRRIDKSRLSKEVLLQHIVQLKAGHDVMNDSGELLFKNEEYTLPPHRSLSYAYCSDTAYNESMIEQLREVNLLYHEATFMEIDMEKAIETKHSTSRQAALIARACQAEQLVLGHFSARYRDLDLLLAEASVIFQQTSLAVEGETIQINE